MKLLIINKYITMIYIKITHYIEYYILFRIHSPKQKVSELMYGKKVIEN